jgi:hypothetical protein
MVRMRLLTGRALVAGLVLALALVVACRGDETKDSGSSPADNPQGVAPTTAASTGTPPLSAAASPSPAPGATTAVTPGAANAAPRPATTPATVAITPAAVAPPRASGSTVIVSFPFDNAVQARESLLGVARFGPPMDSLDNLDPLEPKAYPAWSSAYPNLRLVGSAVNATPQTVSVYRGALNAKDPASSGNPKVIVFATMDNKGACAGGVIRGFPTYNDYEVVDIANAPCQAQSALNVLRR